MNEVDNTGYYQCQNCHGLVDLEDLSECEKCGSDSCSYCYIGECENCTQEDERDNESSSRIIS